MYYKRDSDYQNVTRYQNEIDMIMNGDFYKYMLHEYIIKFYLNNKSRYFSKCILFALSVVS